MVLSPVYTWSSLRIKSLSNSVCIYWHQLSSPDGLTAVLSASDQYVSIPPSSILLSVSLWLRCHLTIIKWADETEVPVLKAVSPILSVHVFAITAGLLLLCVYEFCHSSPNHIWIQTVRSGRCKIYWAHVTILRFSGQFIIKELNFSGR